MPDNSCPVCGSTLLDQPKVSQCLDTYFYDCPRCGKYGLNDLVKFTEGFDSNKYLISAWIRRQNKLGNRYPSIGIAQGGDIRNWFDNLDLHRAGFPQDVGEELDALLLAYADIVKNEYAKVVKIQSHPYLPAEIAARDMNEVVGLNEYLEQLGYVSCPASHTCELIIVTAKGWSRIKELRQSSKSSDSAFIAMWFDSCMDKYRQATTQAVRDCGYNPIIIDEHEFTGFVMEQVTSLIRRSRVLIADLSCKPEIDDAKNPKVKQGVRGGVYWEAGIAYGMGKTVIQTCQRSDESTRRVHFDLDQYQTIFWTDDELAIDIRDLDKPIPNPNFAGKLAQRIITTVGRGGHTSD
jgi:hypothetical protein